MVWSRLSPQYPMMAALSGSASTARRRSSRTVSVRQWPPAWNASARSADGRTRVSHMGQVSSSPQDGGTRTSPIWDEVSGRAAMHHTGGEWHFERPESTDFDTRARTRTPADRGWSTGVPQACWKSAVREQPLAEVAAEVRNAGQHDEVATTERLDVVGHRLVLQPVLVGLELVLDVLLVAAEDQPGLGVSVQPHTDVLVVVATAQDPAAVGLRRARVGQPDVRVQRDQLAVRVGGVVRDVGLVGAVQRSAVVAVSSDDRVLFRDADPVPELDQHP